MTDGELRRSSGVASDLEAGGASDVDAARFREVLGHFATGVAVVTGMDDEGPFGFSCQAFHSLSLDPPLVVIAPSLNSESWPRIQKVGSFCVNVLAENQESLCRAFATKGKHKFQGVGWRPGTTGSPILSDVLAWVECRPKASHEGGDHLIVVANVITMGVGESTGASARPLLFYRGGYGRFEA